MDYTFWRKNVFENLEDDQDLYSWLIQYIWKAQNDKLFLGIDRNLHKLVQYAEGECHAQNEANKPFDFSEVRHETYCIKVLSFQNICMFDGSWRHDTPLSGCE